MLSVERRGAVAVWTIDRPGAKNALDQQVMGELSAAVGEAARDPGVRAAILTGAGDTFVSGGDLRELRDRTSASDAEVLTDTGFELLSAIAALPFPVVAAIPGHAIGGGAELALACDLRVAEERAVFSFKQVRMAVTTAWGTVPRLVALAGAGTAARLLYTAASIDAAEAKALGLVDAVVANGTSMDMALAWTAEIVAGSPAAVAGMKRLVAATSAEIATKTRALERALFVETWSSADHAEAVAAHFERRAARFTGR